MISNHYIGLLLKKNYFNINLNIESDEIVINRIYNLKIQLFDLYFGFMNLILINYNQPSDYSINSIFQLIGMIILFLLY